MITDKERHDYETLGRSHAVCRIVFHQLGLLDERVVSLREDIADMKKKLEELLEGGFDDPDIR